MLSLAFKIYHSPKSYLWKKIWVRFSIENITNFSLFRLLFEPNKNRFAPWYQILRDIVSNLFCFGRKHAWQMLLIASLISAHSFFTQRTPVLLGTVVCLKNNTFLHCLTFGDMGQDTQQKLVNFWENFYFPDSGVSPSSSFFILLPAWDIRLDTEDSSMRITEC